MPDYRSQPTTPLAAGRRPHWRHPAVLGGAALLLVLLLIWLVPSDEPEPQDAPVASAESPDVNQSQWADFLGTTAAPTETQPAGEEPEPPGRTFIAKLNLQPRLSNGRVRGYVVRPDDPSILKGTPLQPGDVLMEVDGMELDAKRAAALAKDVGDYQDVYIRFERGNVEQDGILPLGTR